MKTAASWRTFVWAYSAVFTDNNPGCRDLQKKSPHGPLGREARQRTASVFTDLGNTQTRRRGGRLVVCRGEREGGVGVYDCPYFLRRPRAEPLQQPAQDYPIFQGGLQKGFRIRDGLLRRFQHPERNQPCNRLFRRIHVQSQQILFNKASVWFLNSLLPRLRCHLCVRTGTRLIHKKTHEMCEREALRENPPPQVGCRWWLTGGNSAGLVSSPEWCVFFPPLTWQAVKCGSLWCVQAADCIHAHRSRQPLIHWMTSHKRDKPVQAVVTALQRDMNRLFLRGFAYPALFYVFTVNKPQAICRYLPPAVLFCCCCCFCMALNKR